MNKGQSLIEKERFTKPWTPNYLLQKSSLLIVGLVRGPQVEKQKQAPEVLCDYYSRLYIKFKNVLILVTRALIISCF
jgi:hypothetical protein